MNKLTLMTLAVALVAGCGKQDTKDTGAGDKGKVATAPTVAIDAAAVNALVPAALKDKIVFEQRGLVIEQGRRPTTYTLAVPKGWTQTSKMFATLKADDKAGFFTSMKVGSNCDGECTPKKWDDIADKVHFAPRAKGNKVIKDERAPGKRTMIAEVDHGGTATTDVILAWWTDGDSRYHSCEVELDPSVKDAAPAFEKACQAVNISGED